MWSPFARSMSLASCLALLSACTSVSDEGLATGTQPIVGAYPYALAKTSFVLTGSVTLTACNAIKERKTDKDFRPSIGLTESLAVTPTFEADPDQLYDVPYDALRRDIGKETSVTVNLYPNGTLSSINGTVNDQYGPGTVAAIQAAVKIAAGVMIPGVGVAEAASAATQAAGGNVHFQSARDHIRKRKPKPKPPEPKGPDYCSPEITAALAAIDDDNQKAYAQANQDAQKKGSLPSPNIAKYQADIARLQGEAGLTKSFRIPWIINLGDVDSTPAAPVATYGTSYPVYAQLIEAWLSAAGKNWLRSHPDSVLTRQVTSAINVQAEVKRFTIGAPLPVGEPGKPSSTPTHFSPGGVVIRDPAQAIVRVCRGDCSTAASGGNTSNELAAPAPASIGQLGRIVVLHLKNRVFENSTLAISLNNDGSVASVGNHTVGTAAAGLGTAGQIGDSAVSAMASYNTALAARNTNTLNNAALVGTLNTDRANCYDAQQKVRASGGVPVGTCD